MVLTLEKDWQKWNEFMTKKRYLVDEDSWGDCEGFVDDKSYNEYLDVLRRRGGVDIVVVHSGNKPIGYLLAMRVGDGMGAVKALECSGVWVFSDDSIAMLSPKPAKGRVKGAYLSLCVMHVKYRGRTHLLFDAVRVYLDSFGAGVVCMVADSRGGISFAERLGLKEFSKTELGKPIFVGMRR